LRAQDGDYGLAQVRLYKNQRLAYRLADRLAKNLRVEQHAVIWPLSPLGKWDGERGE
jgi:hypothetical protein